MQYDRSTKYRLYSTYVYVHIYMYVYIYIYIFAIIRLLRKVHVKSARWSRRTEVLFEGCLNPPK